MTNQVVIRMAKDLKSASAKNDAPIWAKLAEYALKPSIARKNINLNKITKLNKKNERLTMAIRNTGKSVNRKVSVSKSRTTHSRDVGEEFAPLLFSNVPG